MVHPGWRYHPAAKVALLIAAGIGAARLFHPSMEVLLPVLGLLALLVFSLAHLPDGRTTRVLFASLLGLLVVTSGALLYATRGGYDRPLLPSGVSIDRVNLVGSVVAGPKPMASGGMEWEVRVDSLWWRTLVVHPKSHVLVRTYESRGGERGVAPEDILLLRGNLRTPSPPTVPGEFDYGEWLHRRGLFGIVTVPSLREVTRLGAVESSALARLTELFRRSVRAYAARTIGGEEGVIATALLTGDRSEITPEMREGFSVTGTAHVLALSGLHVGALALLLFVLLSWIPNRWVRLSLFVIVLGSYALLTGGSPSILRASLMASLFALAYAIGRISQPLNTLGLAALVILLLDPQGLFDVGFQLSFGAVGGILLFYGRLNRAIDRRLPEIFRRAIPRSILQLFLLSLTAQIGTFPLTAYYFGHLSLLSPLLNVVVVPLITIGFGAAGIGFLFSWIPVIGKVYGATAFLAINGVVRLVSYVSSLTWQGVLLPSFSVIAMVGSLVGVLWTGMARRAGSLLYRSLVVLLLFMIPWALDSLFGGETIEAEQLYVLPLTRSGGVAVMRVAGDSLRLWYAPAWDSDSSAAARLAARYGELLRAESQEIIPIAGPRPDAIPVGLVTINRHGPEYLMRDLPVVLSLTSRRELDIVEIDSMRVLVVPMHGRIGGVREVGDISSGGVGS